jgi:hypothetical protein
VRAIALSALLASTVAVAQPRPPDEGQSRVQALAAALRDQTAGALEGHPGGDLRLAVRVALPEGAPDPEGLVAGIVEPTVARLREEPRWRSVDVLREARVEGPLEVAPDADGYEVRAIVELVALGNFLEVRGAVWDTARGGFGDYLRARALRLGTMYRRVRLDVELRRYVGRLPLRTADTLVARPVPLPGSGYLAIAVADLDADGRAELVAADRDGVEVLGLAVGRGGVPTLRRMGRSTYPPDLPAPSALRRRDLGTAQVRDEGVVLRTTLHGGAVVLRQRDDGLRVEAASGPCASDAFPLDGGGCGTLVAGRDYFERAVAVPGGVGRTAPGRFYARAYRILRTAEGRAVPVEAVVGPTGRLSARFGGSRLGAGGYGTALALGDLEDDGTAELLTSHAAVAGEGDQLSVLRASAGGLRVVWRSQPLEGSVWLATSGDLDGDGLVELLAVEEPASRGRANLWLVR